MIPHNTQDIVGVSTIEDFEINIRIKHHLLFRNMADCPFWNEPEFEFSFHK